MKRSAAAEVGQILAWIAFCLVAGTHFSLAPVAVLFTALTAIRLWRVRQMTPALRRSGVAGTGLLALAMLSVFFSLAAGRRGAHLYGYCLLIVGAVLLAVFVWLEQRAFNRGRQGPGAAHPAV